MRFLHHTLLSAALLGLNACQLVQPESIVNPNVDEDTFLRSADAMDAWVAGTRMKTATAIGKWCQFAEILSDNYFNNHSRSSKAFDFPRLLHTDTDIATMQRSVATLREMADYGLTTVAARQAPTRSQQFELYSIKAYGQLLAGETFTGLPLQSGGEARPWADHLRAALHTLAQARASADSASQRAFVATLAARAWRMLGQKDSAVTMAREALAQSSDFVRQVSFDGENNVNNAAQEAIWGTWFQPLPRLDFLDPKYFQRTSTEQRPITLAKAEEAWLILAEAQLAEADLTGAKATLGRLLQLVNSRPVAKGVNDQLEKRDNGMYRVYPKRADYRVRASASDSLRSGLIVDRQAPALIDIPYISGTSVTQSMIDGLATHDAALELLYLMRQEIFFGEGRRVADLGIRLPLCEVEAAHAAHGEDYTEARIPAFIPTNQGMDDFTIDEETRTVTVTHNMNRVLVDNRRAESVVPFE